MAEAAAAAPSAPGPGGTEAAPDTQTPTLTPEERRSKALDDADPAKTPKLKPVKKAYPGLVDPANDPQDEVIARRKAEKAKQALTPDPPKQREASEAGSKPATAVEAGAPSPAPADSTAEKAGEEPASEAYKFAGKEWKDQAAAEHAHKTMAGMHKALVEREKQERDKAAGWYQEAQRLQQELELVRRGGASSPAAADSTKVPTAGAPASANKALIDELFEAVDPKTLKSVEEQHGVSTAVYWALNKALEMFDKRMNGSLESRFKPLEEQTKTSGEAKRIVETFNGVGSLTDGEGNPAYPHLYDPQFLERTVHAWKQLEWPEASMFTQKAVHTAYLITEDWYRRSGIALPNSSVTPKAPTPTSSDASAVERAAQAITDSLNGRTPSVVNGGSQPALRPTNGAVDPAMAIRRAILAADQRHPVLGVMMAPRKE